MQVSCVSNTLQHNSPQGLAGHLLLLLRRLQQLVQVLLRVLVLE